jgi:hypothetical protein
MFIRNMLDQKASRGSLLRILGFKADVDFEDKVIERFFDRQVVANMLPNMPLV